MTSLLDGPLAKLRRARKQAESLKRDMGAVEESHAPLILAISKIDANAQRLICKVTHVAELPSEWSLLLGEIAHNFRCVLDHLAYLFALTETDGKPPSDPEGIKFPIADTPQKLGKRERLRKQISTDGWTFIQAAQPYNDWDGAEFLPVLRDLSNYDKHRLIQPALLGASTWMTRVNTEGNNCRISPGSKARGFSMIGRPLEPDTQILTADVEVTGPQPSMEVEFHTAAYIALPSGRAINETLDGIGNAVKELVAAAAPIFLPEVLGEKAEGLPRRIETAHRAPPRPTSTKGAYVRVVQDDAGKTWWEFLERLKNRKPSPETG